MCNEVCTKIGVDVNIMGWDYGVQFSTLSAFDYRGAESVLNATVKVRERVEC